MNIWPSVVTGSRGLLAGGIGSDMGRKAMAMAAAIAGGPREGVIAAMAIRALSIRTGVGNTDGLLDPRSRQFIGASGMTNSEFSNKFSLS